MVSLIYLYKSDDISSGIINIITSIRVCICSRKVSKMGSQLIHYVDRTLVCPCVLLSRLQQYYP